MHRPLFDTPIEPGQYPWDHWERDALARGLGEDLAALGRAVYREAHQHGWGRLPSLLASGEVLDDLLFRAPELAGRLYDV